MGKRQLGKKRWLALGFMGLGVLLSDIMCAVVAYHYAYLQNCPLCSAPAWVAFYYCLPFGVGIGICAVAGWWLWRSGG